MRNEEPFVLTYSTKQNIPRGSEVPSSPWVRSWTWISPSHFIPSIQGHWLWQLPFSSHLLPPEVENNEDSAQEQKR